MQVAAEVAVVCVAMVGVFTLAAYISMLFFARPASTKVLPPPSDASSVSA